MYTFRHIQIQTLNLEKTNYDILKSKCRYFPSNSQVEKTWSHVIYETRDLEKIFTIHFYNFSIHISMH